MLGRHVRSRVAAAVIQLFHTHIVLLGNSTLSVCVDTVGVSANDGREQRSKRVVSHLTSYSSHLLALSRAPNNLPRSDLCPRCYCVASIVLSKLHDHFWKDFSVDDLDALRRSAQKHW